jgi:hypothetical protein
MSDETKVCEKCKKEITGSVVTYFKAATATEPEQEKTVCQPCDQSDRMARFRETGYLSTWLVEQEQLKEIFAKNSDDPKGDPDVLAAIEPVFAEVKIFEQEVWFAGLQEFARNIKVKGSKAEQDGLTLMCYTMAGRAMITIEDAHASVTVITIEDELPPKSCMGWRGIQGTGPQAVALLKRACALWKAGMRAKEDTNVSMGI